MSDELRDEYTPTTNWIRIMVGYSMTTATDRTLPVEEAREEGYAWFDRWLARERAAGKAEALEEAQEKVREVPYWVGLESDGDFTAITWSQRSLILSAIRAAGTETGGELRQ